MDTVPTKVIEACAETLSVLIAWLAAPSFNEGKFPTKFEHGGRHTTV
jgi:hypothetical protein